MEEKYRVIIAGGRDFDDFRTLSEVCIHMLQNKKNIEIVSGTANGADKLGEQFARFMGYQIKEFPASWDEFGKAAGHIRNKEMAEYADALIVFWDGESKGTENMIALAKKMNLKVKLHKYTKSIKDEVIPWWKQ
tara:strand:- start:5918 stop:6319 length:402 start_codon:yes stop_codon:yes gene_type:complete